jgi:hypothetical protein
MPKNERGSSDVVFILLVVILVVLAIIVFMNISRGTPFGERLIFTFGSMWSGILSFFRTVISRLSGN